MLKNGKPEAPRASRTEEPRCNVASPLRVLIAAAEFGPLVRGSCVADFTASLGTALRSLGHDVRAVIPLHGESESFDVLRPLHHFDVPILGSTHETTVFEIACPDGFPIFGVENERYFGGSSADSDPDDDERYVFFSKAVVGLLEESSWRPNVVHCVEWHAALVPDYLRAIHAAKSEDAPVSVLTLCDLDRYTPTTLRGRSEMDSPQLTLNLAARGVVAADTVSVNAREHSKALSRLELLTPFFRERSWCVACIETPAVPAAGFEDPIEIPLEEPADPMTDPAIHTAFGPGSVHRKARNKQALQLIRGLAIEPETALIGMLCRLDDAQERSNVITIVDAISDLGLQLVVHGCGEECHERIIELAATASPRSISFRREDPEACGDSTRRLFAAADLFLAPGRDRSDLPIAQRYGAIAIAPRPRTPSPSVPIDFPYVPDVPGSLLAAVHDAIEQYRARDSWSDRVQRAVSTDPHWKEAAQRYERLYRATYRHAKEVEPRFTANSDQMRAF